MKTITLSIINQFSVQEVFEFICKHLLKQNKRSTSGLMCRYRDEENNKCAVGCLISNEEYNMAIEGTNVNSSNFFKYKIKDEIFDLLAIMQKIHDKQEVKYWKIKILEIAKIKNLNIDFLNAS